VDRSERLILEERDAGQTLVRELTKSYPLAAAFWFKYADEDRWHLNATFQSMTRDEFDHAFALVRQILAAKRDGPVDPFEMTFLDIQKPLVQRAIQLTDDVLVTSSHWQLPMHQGASIEGVVVYPKRDLTWKSPIASQAE